MDNDGNDGKIYYSWTICPEAHLHSRDPSPIRTTISFVNIANLAVVTEWSPGHFIGHPLNDKPTHAQAVNSFRSGLNFKTFSAQVKKKFTTTVENFIN